MATGQNTAESPRDPGQLERVGHRIEGQNEQIINACERLERLSDRILGSIPREMEKLTRNPPQPEETATMGINHINGAIDRMSSMGDRLNEAIQRLEQL